MYVKMSKNLSPKYYQGGHWILELLEIVEYI